MLINNVRVIAVCLNMQRKVHAHTGWDACSVRAWWIHKPRQLVLNWLTAGKIPKFFMNMVWIPWKCHSDVAFSEMKRVERGKPHERETQIMVGALSFLEMNEKKDRSWEVSVDRWLPPKYEMNSRLQYCGTKHGLQNVINDKHEKISLSSPTKEGFYHIKGALLFGIKYPHLW